MEARQTMGGLRSGKGDGRDREGIPNSRLTDDNDAELSKLQLGRRHCTTKDQQGRLHHGHISVTSKDVRFETAVRSRTLWTLPWNDVSAISKARTDSSLCFEVGHEAKYSVDALKGRNELFTQIIGYSGLSWQVEY